MFNIAEYLKKFSRLESNSALEKQAVNMTLKEICGLENVDFEVNRGVLYIKADPLLKSIVFMKKDVIIEYLKRKFPQSRIEDVR